MQHVGTFFGFCISKSSPLPLRPPRPKCQRNEPQAPSWVWDLGIKCRKDLSPEFLGATTHREVLVAHEPCKGNSASGAGQNDA